MKWPEIVELNDVTITPLYPSDDPGDLRFAASQTSPAFGHYRFGRPDSVLKVLPLSEGEAADARVIEDPFIYGGLLFRHFGHTIAESIHRVWPRFASDSLGSAKVVFTPVRTMITPYLVEALNLHGIDESEVLRLKKPLCFRRLFVGAQARQMGGPTLIEKYQSMLDPMLDHRLPSHNRERRLYISRLDYHWSGSFYGESAVARELMSAGFEIIYPERHSLTELVTMLRETRIAIFAEGSAIHALELCGSKVPDVLMISRRPNSQKRFARLFANICRRWLISDHLLFNAGLADFHKKHSGVVDLAAVMRDIQSFIGMSLSGNVTPAWVADAIEEDCERLIADAQGEAGDDHGQRAAALRAAIRAGVAVVYDPRS